MLSLCSHGFPLGSPVSSTPLDIHCRLIPLPVLLTKPAAVDVEWVPGCCEKGCPLFQMLQLIMAPMQGTNTVV